MSEPEPIKPIVARVLDRIDAHMKARIRQAATVFPGTMIQLDGVWRRIVVKPEETNDGDI